jgi:hypothetical protein
MEFKMAFVVFAFLAGLLGLLWLGRVIRDFDRKMVAAGERRKIESAARAAAAAAGRGGHLAATRVADGTVQYVVQFEGDRTPHRLTFGKPEASGDMVPFHLLPG